MSTEQQPPQEPSPYSWEVRRLALRAAEKATWRDTWEGLKMVAVFLLLPVGHWYLFDSWLAWGLTLPIMMFGQLGYVLYKGAQIGPGRGDR